MTQRVVTELVGAGSVRHPATSPWRAPGGATLRACVEAQLEGLLALTAQSPGAAAKARAILDLLGAESLDRPVGGPFEGLSFINADGVPFQWVIRVGPGGADWGFLAETGRPFTPAPERLRLTLDRVAAASRVTGDAPPPLDRIAQLICPTPGEPWPDHWRSAAWTGVAVGGDALRLKPYFNLNRGDARERWLRLGRLLKAFGRERALARVCRLSGPCSPGFWPVGLAVDLTAPGGVGRIKAYFRSEAVGPTALVPWYDACGPCGSAEALRAMLDLLGQTGADRYAPGAFVVSLEVHADERLSLKTDLAVTKWLSSDAQVVEAAEALTGRLGLATGALTRTLSAIGVDQPDEAICAVTRFVGLGCEPDGRAHLNVYVSPPRATPSTRPRRRSRSSPPIHGAVERGVAALLAACSDGHWTDFCLPVGVSDRWVTACLLARLADVEQARPMGLARHPAIGEALDWLESARGQAGWSYNGVTPDDADSTAWALLALRGWDRSPPAAAVGFLQGCLREGQAMTYPADATPRTFWSAPAPDVTAVALRALSACGIALPAELSLPDPSPELPQAFWWVTPLYVLAARTEGAARVAPAPALDARLAGFRTQGAFERALLLRLLSPCGAPARTCARALVAEQARSGLWAPSARLRLVMSPAAEPWREIASGAVFLDERGLFTTATVIAALAATAPTDS